MKSGKLKGSLIALLATICFSNVYIFSKLAMQDVSLASFGILWFGFALTYNLIFYWFFTDRTKFSSLSSKAKHKLLFIGLSELLSTSAFFLAVKVTPNPAIVSFLANTSPVFVIAISFLFLSIRYNWLSILGVFITLLGVGLINYTETGFDLTSFLNIGSVAALIFSFFYGASLVIAGKDKSIIPTSFITICRNLFLWLGFIVYHFISNNQAEYHTMSVLYMALGSFLGPFLGVYLTFKSLKFVDASITTIIGTARSLFIILGAFLFLQILPNTYELIGGSLTIVGIIIITGYDYIKKGANH
jgi:drug/metabolite transporter (DMT)-like permease